MTLDSPELLRGSAAVEGLGLLAASSRAAGIQAQRHWGHLAYPRLRLPLLRPLSECVPSLESDPEGQSATGWVAGGSKGRTEGRKRFGRLASHVCPN